MTAGKGSAVFRETLPPQKTPRLFLAGTVASEKATSRAWRRFFPQNSRAFSPAEAPRGDQSRMGITTYRTDVLPGERIRQLLFASVSPSSTFSVSIAASASSR
jgi:hypothetical protein